MISRLIIISLILIGMVQSNYSQKNSYDSKEKKVAILVDDFNKTLFIKMDVKTAIETYYYLKKIDTVDLKFGLESDFTDETESFMNIEDKIDYFAMQFYWNRWYGSLLPLIWSLGTNKISNNSKLCDLDDAMAQNQKLRKVWDKELAKIGLKKRLPKQDLDENNVNDYTYLTKRLNSAVAKKINNNLLANNLKFISEHTTIKKEDFEGREYFTVENQIFIYKVAIKNGVPKIISVNCNC